MGSKAPLTKHSLPDLVRSGNGAMPKMTLKQLGYFVAAAQHQSVLKAAQALHISSPSISAAVAHLETVTGVQLFVRRHARGLVLTRVGQDFMLEARNILIHVRELEHALHSRIERVEGRLDVGCLVSFAPFLLLPLLRGFTRRYPKIQVRWREGDHEALIDGLEKGAFDVVLLYDFDMPSTVHCEPLRKMPVQVVLPAGHRLVRRARVSLMDLREEPFVLLDLPRTRDYFLSIFAEQGLEPQIGYRAQSYEMLRGLVANGFGYSILNFCPPYAYRGQGEIVSRPLSEKARATNLVFARHYRYKPSHIVEEFRRYAVEFAERLPIATHNRASTQQKRTSRR